MSARERREERKSRARVIAKSEREREERTKKVFDLPHSHDVDDELSDRELAGVPRPGYSDFLRRAQTIRVAVADVMAA